MKNAKEYKKRCLYADSYDCYDMQYFDSKSMYQYHKKMKKFYGAEDLKGTGTRARIYTIKEKIKSFDYNVYQLESYYTRVCEYSLVTGEFVKLWDGYSSTTMRHINIFRKKYGLPKLSKYDWFMMDVGEYY